jgi:hypothetical protein
VTDYIWPVTLTPSRSRFSMRDLSGRFVSPFTGTTYAYSRPGGDILSLGLDMPPMTAADSAAFRAFISRLRGAVNRVWCGDHVYVKRGSFATSELMTNNTFGNGTTGWTVAAEYSLSVADRVMRTTRLSNDGSNSAVLRPVSTFPVTQYAPYVVRFLIQPGRGLYASGFTLYDIVSSTRMNSASSDFGMLTAAYVPYNTTLRPELLQEADAASSLPGDYVDVVYTSTSRCALVDNGPNSLPYSDQFDNAAWTKTRSSISANSAVAPDGTTTADSLIEDSTATNTHQVQKTFTCTSAAQDISASCSFKAGTRTWVRLVMSEATGSTGASVYVNLSTGALGTEATGANWSNLRTFTVDQGNGWYRAHVVARKTNSATSIFFRADLATADNTNTYSGNGTSLCYIWRATINPSSVPFRATDATTTVASTGTSQTGTGLYLKGLPASSSGLLLPGDVVQIGNELIEVSASLDSNSAGLGYLQLHRPPRTSPADNDPVIILEPRALFMLGEAENGWENVPGRFTNASVTLVEAPR